MSSSISPEAQLDECLSKFEPAVVDLACACLAYVRKLCPGATELVYDAYNALSIPFSTSEKLAGAFVAVVVYPKHVNLGFNRGTELDDPDGLLEGTGTLIRHVRIDDEKALKSGALTRLVREAAKNAGFEKGTNSRIVIKKIYANQRSRRPVKKK